MAQQRTMSVQRTPPAHASTHSSPKSTTAANPELKALGLSAADEAALLAPVLADEFSGNDDAALDVATFSTVKKFERISSASFSSHSPRGRNPNQRAGGSTLAATDSPYRRRASTAMRLPAHPPSTSRRRKKALPHRPDSRGDDGAEVRRPTPSDRGGDAGAARIGGSNGPQLQLSSRRSGKQPFVLHGIDSTESVVDGKLEAPPVGRTTAAAIDGTNDAVDPATPADNYTKDASNPGTISLANPSFSVPGNTVGSEIEPATPQANHQGQQASSATSTMAQNEPSSPQNAPPPVYKRGNVAPNHADASAAVKPDKKSRWRWLSRKGKPKQDELQEIGTPTQFRHIKHMTVQEGIQIISALNIMDPHNVSESLQAPSATNAWAS